ncbi:acetolactate synthase small subunit [Candidatus Bathyarchaeota archaeon]|jgi:acetolactate synthase-1/3 small subunit|nr:acetolactate synthase small subunit [Candidatus Bathyarchaeota archaeon]
MGKEKTRVIAALVENKPGVLHSVSNMFRRRDFNIESITVGGTEQEDLSRMTITVKGDEKTLEQVVKQMSKLIDVVKVSQLEPENIVTRELALIKVNIPDNKSRSDVINCVEVFRGRVVDVSPESLTMEITGTPDKIDAFLNLMKTYGIMELARTGLTALSRGVSSIRVDE